MIANNSQILTEASKTLYQLNADEIMRQRCRARQDAILYEEAMKRLNQAQAVEIEELNSKVGTLTAEKEAWDAEREQLLAKLAEYESKDMGST